MFVVKHCEYCTKTNDYSEIKYIIMKTLTDFISSYFVCMKIIITLILSVYLVIVICFGRLPIALYVKPYMQVEWLGAFFH